MRGSLPTHALSASSAERRSELARLPKALSTRPLIAPVGRRSREFADRGADVNERSGTYDKAGTADERLSKDKVYFRYTDGSDEALYEHIDAARADERVVKHRPRFLIVKNDHRLLAGDQKSGATLDIEVGELASNATFFGAWAGFEKPSSRTSTSPTASRVHSKRCGAIGEAFRVVRGITPRIYGPGTGSSTPPLDLPVRPARHGTESVTDHHPQIGFVTSSSTSCRRRR